MLDLVVKFFSFIGNFLIRKKETKNKILKERFESVYSPLVNSFMKQNILSLSLNSTFSEEFKDSLYLLLQHNRHLLSLEIQKLMQKFSLSGKSDLVFKELIETIFNEYKQICKKLGYTEQIFLDTKYIAKPKVKRKSRIISKGLDLDNF